VSDEETIKKNLQKLATDQHAEDIPFHQHPINVVRKLVIK
jgi:hypothetical protein